MSEHDAGQDTEQDQPVCYRHPDRPALLRCSRCERPVCADDAIEAPVGYQCRECASGGQRVRHLGELMPDFTVTKVLVGLLAVGFVLTAGSAWSVTGAAGALVPLLVGRGEFWRLVTSGFVHAGIIHIGFNGYLLWMLGQMLEPTLGHRRFVALYAAGLAGGSLGVVFLGYLTVATPLLELPVVGQLLATMPNRPTVGASGAVFGLFGAAMVGLRQRGVNPWRTDIGTLVLLNLVITFVFSSAISVGGHVGGLLAGLAIGKLVFVPREQERRATALATGAAAAMLVLAVVLANSTVAALGL